MITKKSTSSHEDWLNLRHQYIGGSDAAAVVGLNNYVSPFSLWCEKTDRVPGFAGNLATEVGTYMEDFVAKLFARETGKKVRNRNQSFFNSDYPWAIANIDREVVGENAGLEIKTTSELCLSKFKGGEYPAHYYCQCMHYMAVTGKKKWYLAVLIGNHDFRWFTIDRDEDEIAALMQAEKDFWEHVKNDTPPEVDGSDATSKSLGALYDDNGGSVDLTPVSDYLRMYRLLCDQEKEVKKKKEDAANHIKQTMGTASTGSFDDFKVTWKEQSRSSIDKKALMEAHPEIDLDDYTTVSKSRVFRLK